MTKIKARGIYGDLLFPKKAIQTLQPYYYQGGKWYKLRNKKKTTKK